MLLIIQFEIRESSVRKGIQNKKIVRNRFHKHFI
ncbi:cysteine ABC transporter permease [Bacillus mycoides]|uniref:Cysteine ABC transporter permease n=3 Tax=Bacillus cereus group TaxID=86661 RepID=A0A1S9T8U0_BACMY|nr:cysteine ABC transporter permease [Bacillus mycoides]OOR12387.1 cysteine ABC transporter permease [Bacillus cereus]OTY09251.1 cysteine ABC transporter permease [Bacillus thuringiensis serovar navarrensis]PRD09331.1 cysteine ABC transporter permease [Bacillus sp. MYb56]RAN68437.1 cysteine ABC transporter permease [Bacillus sp. SRB_8]RAN85518.1 cysteine ABC transporter permease [Bacillus sp. SRB_331]RAN91523.1 cysteine ABC transporter permease [Bacillus sp. SRB_28]